MGPELVQLSVGPPAGEFADGNMLIIVCATGSIRLPGVPGVGWRLAGNNGLGLPGLM